MRKTLFAINEFYHIYNRGVDKRTIFEDKEDLLRFLSCIDLFNVVDPIGSVYEQSFLKPSLGSSAPKLKLVNIIAYCLNQNHFHFILEPLIDNGIQKFMHKLSTGYTNYFNTKNDRSGALFQGRYKSIHTESNAYLLHLSVYVNLNNRVHIGLNQSWLEELQFTSFDEYRGLNLKIKYCLPNIILDQFDSIEKYINYAYETLPDIIKRKEEEKELKNLLLE